MSQSAHERFLAAHRALRGDPAIQFDLPPVPPPPEPPAWLLAFGRFLKMIARPIGRFLEWLGQFVPDLPYSRILLGIVLVGLAAAVVWYLWLRVDWRPQFARRGAEPEPDWRPDAQTARTLLRAADALAADGQFAEAVHLLLRRSVEDIALRRPQLVRPALTSRDLAESRDLPFAARTAFAAIARLVERSLFGGAALGEGEWTSARKTYADFALPGAWR